MKIDTNISFNNYLSIEDKREYNYIEKYSRLYNRPVDVFDIGPFEKMPFIKVKDIQYKFGNTINWQELFNFVTEEKQIKSADIAKMQFKELCNFKSYIKESLERIEQLESNLSYQASDEDEEAGIDNLSIFGVLIQIDSLANGDITKYEQIKQLPYEDCFTKLLMKKRIDEYTAEKNRLINRRNRQRK